MCYQWNEGPQIVHQPIPIQRLHLGVAYLACIYANLHSHSESFLAHRMVKNDQYTAGISQLIWKKIQRNGFLGQISHLKKHRLDGEWTIFFSWMDRIVANRLLLYNTGSVLHFNAMIPQQNTSHPPQYTTPLPLSHHRTCQAREPDGRELQPTSWGEMGCKNFFFLELTKSKTTLAHAQGMGSKASWGNIGWVELCLPGPTSLKADTQILWRKKCFPFVVGMS